MWANNKRTIIILLGQTILLFCFYGALRGRSDYDYLKEIAAQLKMVGVNEEALHLYQQYLQKARLSKKEEGAIVKEMARILQTRGDYAQSLTLYYLLADYYKLDVDDAQSNIYELLERLGKSAAAKHELNQRTSVQEKANDVVVASVNKRNIYLSELNRAIDQLPPHLSANFKDVQNKRDFLNNLVVDQLLVSKAKRMGLDRKDLFRDRLQYIADSMLKEELLRETIKSKIDIAQLHTIYQSKKGGWKDKNLLVSHVYKKDKSLSNFNDLVRKGDAQVDKYLIKNIAQLVNILSSLQPAQQLPALIDIDDVVVYVDYNKKEKTLQEREMILSLLELARQEQFNDGYKKLVDELMKNEDIQFFKERVT